MRIIPRSEFGWGPTSAATANPRNGLVIHYDGSNQGLARKSHSACVEYWKRTRKFHMGPARGWADIGYSYGACPHGYVLEGRGLNRVQAAQPGGNSTWYSVTLMGGPDEDPTPEQIEAVRQLRAWLMSKGVAGAVKGHRDFYATSCPGDRLYRLVKNGTFAKPPSGKGAKPPSGKGGDEDMPLTDADAKKVAQAVVRELTHKTTTNQWAVKQGIFKAGDEIDPKTALRQTWAYGKDTHARVRRLEEAVERLTAAVTRLQAQAEGAVESK